VSGPPCSDAVPIRLSSTLGVSRWRSTPIRARFSTPDSTRRRCLRTVPGSAVATGRVAERFCPETDNYSTMLRSALQRLYDWWTLDEDPDERIEGSGKPIRDPAYNGRYTAERRLDDLVEAAEGEDEE